MIYGPDQKQGPWTCQKQLDQHGPHNLVQWGICYNGCFQSTDKLMRPYDPLSVNAQVSIYKIESVLQI